MQLNYHNDYSFWFGNLDTRNLDTSVFETTACYQPSKLTPACLPLPLEKNNHCKCCIFLLNLLHAHVKSNMELIHDKIQISNMKFSLTGNFREDCTVGRLFQEFNVYAVTLVGAAFIYGIINIIFIMW